MSILNIIKIPMRSVWGDVVEYVATDATALAYGNGYDGESSGDGLTRNALAHAHVSASIYYDYGSLISVSLGDIKEWLPGGDDPNDQYKDQYNNEVGRRIAAYARDYNLSKDAIDDLIINALNNGHLIINPDSDPRVVNETSPTWTSPVGYWQDDALSRDYDALPLNITGDFIVPALNITNPAVTVLLPAAVRGIASLFHDGENAYVTPIVLDIDMSGTIELAALNGVGSVYWDIDNDGFREASGWIVGDDGLLCAPGENGIVDNHAELFGNNGVYANGYLMLDALYDSNNDDVITAADTSFSDLRVWIDANSDGYSQSDELFSLTNLGITSISTAYSNVNYSIAGNQIKQESTFAMNGNSYTSVDAWLAYDNVNSRYDGEYDLDIRALFLPTLRGFGTLPDLHIAMSLDETLLEMVQDLTLLSSEKIFGASSVLIEDVRAILHRWAGVDAIDPASRGGNIDARDLAFLEAFMGEDFYSEVNFTGNPWAQIVPFVVSSWTHAIDLFLAQIVVQTPAGQSIFTQAPVYDHIAGDIVAEGALDFSAIESILIASNGHSASLAEAWVNLFRFIDSTIGLSNLSAQDQLDLELLVGEYSTGMGLTFYALSNIIYDPLSIDLDGGIDNDVIVGSRYATALDGGQGNDVLIGGNGKDHITGGAGNDVLISGKGWDTLIGGNGDDTYFFKLHDSIDSGGNPDVITESASGGVDQILFGQGILPENIRLWTTYLGNLEIQYSDNDIISVSAGAGTNGSLVGERLEQIVFSDSAVVWDLTAGLYLRGKDVADNLYGSAGHDTILGENGNDTIYGYSGDDILRGGDGDDDLYGGIGNDTLYGGIGKNTLIGGAGDDTYVFNLGDGIRTSPSLIGTYYNQIAENANEGTDRILFGEGILPEHVRLWTISGGPLYIQYSENDYIWVNTPSGANGTLVGQRVEQIVFADNTTWDLTAGLDLRGDDAANSIYASSNSDIILGEGGNDIIYAYSGDDIIYGGEDDDTLYGGSGNDTLYGGVGKDFLIGGAGDDTYVFNLGDGIRTSPSLIGTYYNQIAESANEGTDRILFGEGILPEHVRLWAPSWGALYIQYSENDYIWVNISGDPNGILVGQLVEQIVFADNTTWDLTAGLYMRADDAANTIYGSAYSDTIFGEGGTDIIYGYAGNDVIYGGAGTDGISGGDGNDTLYGGADNDNLTGEDGNDTLYGGSGNDVLYGGDGADNLYGESGADRFVFEGATAFNNVDFIRDFNILDGDSIDLSGLLSLYDPLADAITDFVWISESGSSSNIFVDRDGLGSAYSLIAVATLSGVTGLTDEVALVTNGNLIVT